MPVPSWAMTAPHGMEPQGPPRSSRAAPWELHWNLLESLNFSFADYLLHFTEGFTYTWSLPENKQMPYQWSFPKPATVWLDTNKPTFLRAPLHCWERTKPSTIKTPQKGQVHFFAALYHTSVFRHQPFFLIYQDLSGVSATQQLIAPGQFFFPPFQTTVSSIPRL